MGAAWALLMPLGGILIRLLKGKNVIWYHAGWMSFAYTIVLAGFGTGIWIAIAVHKISSAHAIIGIITTGSLLLQPVTGLAHHVMYKKVGRPNAYTYPHVWWGRAILTLGIINGGLGLQLARPYYAEIPKGEIAYGVVAGVVWVVWVIVIIVSYVKSRGVADGETGAKVAMQSTSDEHIQKTETNSTSDEKFGSHRSSVAKAQTAEASVV